MQTVHSVFVFLMNHYSHNAVHKEKAELLTYCIISYISTNRFFLYFSCTNYFNENTFVCVELPCNLLEPMHCVTGSLE